MIGIIVPSRGRPQAAEELIRSWRETSDPLNGSQLLIAVDEDDSTSYPEYDNGVFLKRYPRTERGMTEIVNLAAQDLAEWKQVEAIGFMGDDHRFRTKFWDRIFLQKIRENLGFSICYGNDLLQGERLPTAVVMGLPVYQKIGYFCPPKQKHLWLDDFWRVVGLDTGLLSYFPEVIIEHMHHSVGKSNWDETYAEANSVKNQGEDKRIFDAWLSSLERRDLAVRIMAAHNQAMWDAEEIEEL